MLESGWEELGMDDQWAARVATDMVDNDDPAGGLDFYKVRWVPWVYTVGVVMVVGLNGEQTRIVWPLVRWFVGSLLVKGRCRTVVETVG